MKIIHLCGFVLLSFYFISCDDNPISSSDELNGNIYELVFSDLFINNGSGHTSYYADGDTSIKAYYIEFYSGVDSNYFYTGNPFDPSEEFLNRFNGYPKPVKKGSECNKSINGVFDKVTNQRGMILYAANIEIVSSTEFIVNAGWFYGGLSAGGYTYRIIKDKDQLWIYKKIARWVS